MGGVNHDRLKWVASDIGCNYYELITLAACPTNDCVESNSCNVAGDVQIQKHKIACESFNYNKLKL